MPYTTINNLNLHYKETGKGDAVIFLHGYTGSSNDWNNQIGSIKESYYAIAIDHRGHGKSEAPASEEHYSIPISAQDLYALIRHFGIEKCCLVGHSMGGFMSLQFVLENPGLVHALILVDTSSGTWDLPPGYDKVRSRLDELARNEGLEAAFEFDVASNPIKKEKFRKHPELLEIARQKVMNTSVDGYIYFARAFKKWTPVTNRLNEIDIPVLIVVGEEDLGFINASKLLNDSIKNSELVMIPGAGHNPNEEQPELFNRSMIPFLKNHL